MTVIHKISRIYTTIVAFLVVSCCFAQMFTNIRATQAMTISAMTEAGNGNVWFASGKTIYRFDGELIYPIPSPVLDDAGAVNCMYCNAEGKILVGSERGLVTYDTKHESFEADEQLRGVKVRGVLEDDDKTEWIITNKGLYRNRELFSDKKDYQSVSLSGNKLYVSSGNEITVVDVTRRKCIGKIQAYGYVTSLLEDGKGGVTVGTSDGVYVYDAKSKSLTAIASDLPVVKCLVKDAGGVLMAGCDGGLFELGNDVRQIVHDARNSSSIAGNVVWCMKIDHAGNLWLGTDNGIAVKTNSQSLCIYPLFSVTKSGEGNQVYCILQDSRDRLWLGGSNGIVCIDKLNTNSQSYIWYEMNSSEYEIPHNRIRMFYEDPVWGIWACTDGGLLHLDDSTSQWKCHRIKADTHNWVYSVEREAEAMVVRTFDGVYRVRPKGDSLLVLQKVDAKTNLNNMYSSALIGDTEWKITPNGLRVINDKMTREYDLPEKFVSIFYDADDNIMYLGGSDKFAILYPDIFLKQQQNELWFNPDARYVEEDEDAPVVRSMVIVIICVIIALIVVIIMYFVQQRKNRQESEHRQAVLRGAMEKLATLENDNISLLQQLHLQQITASSNENMVQGTDAEESQSADEQFIMRVTQIVEENIDNPELSVTMLSELMGISGKQLYRKIKQYTDLTAVEYIRKLRLQKATLLLRNPDFTINEVMYMVGFTNPSYFSRSFAFEYGMPPTEYRLTAGKKAE